MWRWLHERWVRCWWLDAVAAVAFAVVCGWLITPGSRLDLLGQLSLEDRRNIYTDLVTLATIFAGFGGVVFAIFIGLQSRSIREIKERIGAELLRVWISALVSPWFCAFIIVIAKIVDRGNRGSINEARWIATAATILVGLQLVRVLWVFYALATIEVQGEKPTIKTAPQPAQITGPSKKSQKQAEATAVQHFPIS